MDAIATRPHPLDSQIGHPLKAKPCECDNPLADPRELCCVWCGRQVGGVPLPSGRGSAKSATAPADRPAKKRRSYGGAP
jgi:hypothetical protein